MTETVHLRRNWYTYQNLQNFQLLCSHEAKKTRPSCLKPFFECAGTFRKRRHVTAPHSVIGCMVIWGHRSLAENESYAKSVTQCHRVSFVIFGKFSKTNCNRGKGEIYDNNRLPTAKRSAIYCTCKFKKVKSITHRIFMSHQRCFVEIFFSMVPCELF